MLEKNENFFGSMRTALAWGLVVIILLLAFFISDILINFLAAIIFAIALDKPIDKLVHRKVPRKLAAISIYIIFLLVLSSILYVLLPPLAREISNFTNNLPEYLEKIFNLGSVSYLSSPESTNITQYFQAISDIIGTGSQTIFGKIFMLFGGVASFLVIFFVALFLNIQEHGVRNLIFVLVPKKYLAYSNTFFNKMQDNFTGWLWGKLVSSIIVAIIIYFGLLMMGIPYAMVFAVIALILNFIPFVGPVIAVIVPAIVGFTMSFFDGFMVIVLFFVVNSIIEGFVLMPLLMKKAINMNPILLIFFALIGGRLAGILGIIISIPVAAVTSLIISELWVQKSEILSDEDKE